MWFFLALLAGLLFAANRLIVRSALIKNVNPLTFGSIHDLLSGILLFPIALLNFSLPQSYEIWIALILGVFFIFLTDLFTFLSLKNTETSLYQIVGQLRHVVVLFGAYLLFTEIISPIKIISIILITLGVGIALMEKLKIKITKGVIYAFLSTIFIALAFLFIKKASIDVAPAFSASLSLMVAGLLIYLTFIGNRERQIKLLPSENRKKLIIAAFIFAVFELTLFTALSIGEASRVTPVQQSSMIFTLIGGYLFLNERSRILQKVIGSTLIALGIILLYFI